MAEGFGCFLTLISGPSPEGDLQCYKLGENSEMSSGVYYDEMTDLFCGYLSSAKPRPLIIVGDAIALT